MKKLLLSLLLLNLVIISNAQDCNIGNEVATPDFGFPSVGIIFGANYLLGVKFTLAQEGTLYSCNLLGEGTGSGVQMAVYDDNMGVPNNLMAASALGTVGTGIVSLAVSPVVLPPGDYWVMAVYEINGDHSKFNYNATDNLVYYKSLQFGEPIPTNASDFVYQTQNDFLYFLEIGCGNLSVVGNMGSHGVMKVYPNPSHDYIGIAGLQQATAYTIVNALGMQVGQGTIAPEGSIAINNLATGFYGLQLTTGQTFKFVRE